MLRLRVRVVRAGSAAMQGTWMAGIGGLLLVLGVSGAGQAAAQTATDGTLIEPGGVQQVALAHGTTVAVSADESWVLVADGPGGRLQACRSDGAGALRCLEPQAAGVAGEIKALALLPSGRYAYAVMRDGTQRFLAVFQVDDGGRALRYQQRYDLPSLIDPQGLAIAPGGSRLYVPTPGRGIDIFSISLHDGSLTWLGATLSRTDVRAFAVSPDGRRAYAVDPGGITRYEVLPDFLVRLDYTPQPQLTSQLAVSPDGSHLYAAGADAGRGLLVIDLDSHGRPARTRNAMSTPRWVSAFALSASGQRLYATDMSPELAWWSVRAPMFPAGTYQASCSGSRYDVASGVLEASCAQPRDPPIDSRLDYKLQCAVGSTVSNDNGKLVCDSWRWLPPGSWRAACRGIEFDGWVVRADCGSGVTWSPGVELDYVRACPPNASVGFAFDPGKGGYLYCPADG